MPSELSCLPPRKVIANPSLTAGAPSRQRTRKLLLRPGASGPDGPSVSRAACKPTEIAESPRSCRGLSVNDSYGLKSATTDWSPVIETVQLPSPTQAPAQPRKVGSRALVGVAVRVTVVPLV